MHCTKKNRQIMSWSDLPVEIIRSIAGLLQEEPDDLHNFRLTCKQWRRSTAISVILPLPIDSTPPKNLYFSSVSLLRPRSSTCSSNSPWMVSSIEQSKGSILLCHPFSQNPLLSESSFDFDKFRSTELAVAYHLSYADGDVEDHASRRKFDKVLLTYTRLIPTVDDCVLLALHDGGKLGGYLSFSNQDKDGEGEFELPWIEVKHGSVTNFDDIINDQGTILVVDRRGRLYTIEGDSLEIDTYVTRPISYGRTKSNACRRRFAMSSTGKLYLVERASPRLLKVYKLYKEKAGTMWVEVKTTLGNKVLFVTKDYCFFASASEFSSCDLNDCIVFSNDAFPKYSRTGWELPDSTKSGADILVFRMGNSGDSNFKPISSIKGFSMLLWACPTWVWNGESSPYQHCHCQSHRETKENDETQSNAKGAEEDGETQCNAKETEEEEEMQYDNAAQEDEERQSDAEETEEDEETQSDADSQDGASPALFGPEPLEIFTEARSTSAAQGNISRAETPSSLVPEVAKETTEIPSPSATNEKIIRAEVPSSSTSELELTELTSRMASASTAQERIKISCTMNELEHVAEQASHPHALIPESNDTQSVSQACVNSKNQGKESDSSTVRFEGMNIKSNVLQTLQPIWNKHGNLIENSIIRNREVVARTLETLATVAVILEETSVRFLSDSQVDYLESTLSDLECMHFKVDWLVPYVEKATQLHKSKPLMDSRNQLLHCQAKVAERKAKLTEELAELNKWEKELEEDVASASSLFPFSGNVDFDQPVGCGLS